MYDTYVGRSWRHMDFGGMRVDLRCDVRRLDCRRCGVLVEAVPWAAHGSSFTYRFEDQVAFLAQQANRTAVSELMRIAWRTVGNVIERVTARLGPRDLLSNLRRIGVDELSYRKHHEYITVVVDHDTGRIVWAHPGKNADTLMAFFDELGPERCAALRNVTLDRGQAYIKAVREKARTPSSSSTASTSSASPTTPSTSCGGPRSARPARAPTRPPRSSTRAGRCRRTRGTSSRSSARSLPACSARTSCFTGDICSRRASQPFSTAGR